MTDKKVNLKYGTSPIQRNWNRMAELTSHRLRRQLTKIETAELEYRIAVQNDFANTGKVPEDFIEP